MRIKWYYFLTMSFHAIWEFFLGKNQKTFKTGKNRNYNEEKEYFDKKTLSFEKASLSKWEGAKYAGGSRLSCY